MSNMQLMGHTSKQTDAGKQWGPQEQLALKVNRELFPWFVVGIIFSFNK